MAKWWFWGASSEISCETRKRIVINMSITNENCGLEKASQNLSKITVVQGGFKMMKFNTFVHDIL